MGRTVFQLVTRDGRRRVIPVCRACRHRLVVVHTFSGRRPQIGRLTSRCGCVRRVP